MILLARSAAWTFTLLALIVWAVDLWAERSRDKDPLSHPSPPRSARLRRLGVILALLAAAAAAACLMFEQQHAGS